MSSKISIPDVSVEDDGIYICTATLDGTSIERTSVRVVVHGEYAIDKFGANYIIHFYSFIIFIIYIFFIFYTLCRASIP